MESYRNLVTELGAKVLDKRLEASNMVNLVERLTISENDIADVNQVAEMATSIINDQQEIIQRNNVVKISPKLSKKFVAFLDVKGNYIKQTYIQNMKTVEL